MDVITKESLSGYIAQKAELKRGLDHTAVLVCKLGQKHYRREPDRSFTLIGTGYISLVMFGTSAEAADERFTVGDDVVAFGTFRPRSYERDGQQVEVIEFRTNKLLFDTSHPRYEVTRAQRLSASEDQLDDYQNGNSPFQPGEPSKDEADSGSDSRLKTPGRNPN